MRSRSNRKSRREGAEEEQSRNKWSSRHATEDVPSVSDHTYHACNVVCDSSTQTKPRMSPELYITTYTPTYTLHTSCVQYTVIYTSFHLLHLNSSCFKNIYVLRVF